MVDFAVRVPDHPEADVSGKTCARCRGLGIVTGKPQRIFVTKFGPPPVTKPIVANPGDRCLTCWGRGWTPVAASAHQPLPPPIAKASNARPA